MPVRVDDSGMISLTDMHKASGGEKKNLPSYFLANDKTKSFIVELEATTGNPAVRKINGGKTPGTWSDKLLAYKYAAWIDPKFEVGVYTVLDKFFTGEMIVRPQQELHDFALKARISKEHGSFHGKGLNQRRWEKQELEQEGLRLLQKYQHQFNFTPQALLRN